MQRRGKPKKMIITIVLAALAVGFASYFIGYESGKVAAHELGVESFMKVTGDLARAMQDANVSEEQLALINTALRESAKSRGISV